MSSAASVLTVDGLSVVYSNGNTALVDVDLRVESGERIAIVGESGCGKSTLVRAILGLLPRRSSVDGTVEVNGRSMRGPDRKLRGIRGAAIGYVAQNPAASFDPLRSVGHHLLEVARCHGQTADRQSLVMQLDQLDIDPADEMFDRRPAAWSGGMLQRASIVAATSLRPALLVADEPTSALDRPLARRMLELITARSTTSIVVSHDLELLDGLVDRVVVMYAGRVVEDSSAADALRQPRHPYTAALLAAVPRTGARPIELAGDPPRPDRGAPGCAFAPRCSRVVDACLTVPPTWLDGVRCHLHRPSKVTG